MTTVVVQALTKVKADLTLNRNRLSEANEGLKQQLEVGKSQLDHFDLVIAAMDAVLTDEAKLEELLATVASQGISLPAVEAPPVSQPVAGGSDPVTTAPAAVDSPV